MSGAGSASSIKRLDPDVAVFNRVSVVLQHERAVFAGGHAHSARRDRDLGVINDLDAVLNHRHPGLLDDLPRFDLGLVEGDVIGLPLERRLAGVDRWE